MTAIELMPIADFPGSRNWGYDGVYPFAPDASYGRPEDLKALIDAAHGRGMMVLLDVVYNHFGPEGTYIHTCAAVLHGSAQDAVGCGNQLRRPAAAPVREFFIQNALYWIEEFHFDGLRLDAVHAILDDSPRTCSTSSPSVSMPHCRSGIFTWSWRTRRTRRTLLSATATATATSGITAQWNDDLHHVLHVAATGEATGYYEDYRGDAENWAARWQRASHFKAR